MSEKKTAPLKKFLDGKGFGFIDTPTGDLFFHINDSKDLDIHSLEEGVLLSYELEEDNRTRRLKAINLTIIKD